MLALGEGPYNKKLSCFRLNINQYVYLENSAFENCTVVYQKAKNIRSLLWWSSMIGSTSSY